MLSDKELPSHLRPNPRPISRRDRNIDRLPDRAIESRDPFGHLDPERRRIVDLPADVRPRGEWRGRGR
jgi:hypothetical protein